MSDFVAGSDPVIDAPQTAPIEQTPSKPAPIENRAPEAPVEPEAPKSNEDAIKKAFEKVNAKADAKAADKAADEAKEPKPADKQAAPDKQQAAKQLEKDGDKTVDAPEKETAEAKAERQRAADGKFAAKAPADTADPEKPKAATPAPQRYSPQAKADWDKTPETVRSEITRREAEVEEGFRKNREIIKPLEPYIKMAEEHKTNIPDALERYISLERTLQADPMRGLQTVAEYAGINLRQAAEHILRQSPEQHQAATQTNQARNEAETLRRQLERVEQEKQELAQHAKMTEALSAVQEFAASKPRFQELEDAIAIEVQHGYSLPEAYERAERLNPVPAQDYQADQTGDRKDAQTVAARKSSVTGAPSAGSSPVRSTPPKSNEDALRRAFGKHRI